MRIATRIFFSATLLVSFLVLHRTVTYSYFSLAKPRVFEDTKGTDASGIQPVWPSPVDRVVVMAKMKTENTDWVAQNLPDWQYAIYHMDEPEAHLHVPRNKGREAMAYLTYLIDHYDNLPSTIAFVHSHRDGWPAGWHTDAHGYDNIISLQTLQTRHVQNTGYANLRCKHNPGCVGQIQPFRNPPDPDRLYESAIPEAWSFMFGNASAAPAVIGVACCSQFAVSRGQVLARPLQDYVRIRDWILQTSLSDYDAGRVLEYLWHIIFGREHVQYAPQSVHLGHPDDFILAVLLPALVIAMFTVDALGNPLGPMGTIEAHFTRMLTRMFSYLF